MVNRTVRKEQNQKNLVSLLRWGAWEEDGHGVDVWVWIVVLRREAVVSSVPNMTGQCDFGGCGCVLLLEGMGAP